MLLLLYTDGPMHLQPHVQHEYLSGAKIFLLVAPRQKPLSSAFHILSSYNFLFLSGRQNSQSPSTYSKLVWTELGLSNRGALAPVFTEVDLENTSAFSIVRQSGHLQSGHSLQKKCSRSGTVLDTAGFL